MLLEDASLETKDGKVDEQRDADIKWTANSLYAASIDTVSRSLLPFPLPRPDAASLLFLGTYS